MEVLINGIDRKIYNEYKNLVKKRGLYITRMNSNLFNKIIEEQLKILKEKKNEDVFGKIQKQENNE